MVNDNILRTKNVKDLDYIEIFEKESGTDRYIRFKGTDVADFLTYNDNCRKIIILTIQGKKYCFYADFVVVYKNQETL